jgi:hypothetical protein
MSDERQTEIECLRKFRARARKLMQANRQLMPAAIARACAEMPRTMNKYQHARAVLGSRGIVALPLWK